MPLSGYARLQSAALQLAASFERMFPAGFNRLAVWEFSADGAWIDYATQEPFGTPMDRWGAFLHRGKQGGERYELFELLHEELIGLTNLVTSLARCRRALRDVIRAVPRITREVQIYHDLFRQLRRSRWTEYGIVEWKEVPSRCGEFVDEITFQIHAIPPNVALVREMARVVGETNGPSETDTPQEEFVPSAVQTAILTALTRQAMRTDELARTTQVERLQMFRHLKELKALGRVLHHKKIGFYRPDAPPAILDHVG